MVPNRQVAGEKTKTVADQASKHEIK